MVKSSDTSEQQQEQQDEHVQLQNLSAQQVEQLAAKLSNSSRLLQQQILALHQELQSTRRELARSQRDLAESVLRLREIDDVARDVQDELQAAAAHQEQIAEITQSQSQSQQQHSSSDAQCDQFAHFSDSEQEHSDNDDDNENDASMRAGAILSDADMRSREEQLDELEEEREEEEALMQHVRVLIHLRQTSQHKLQAVIATLVRELSVVKRKEQLLVALALRSRVVTLVPPKLA